jgi:phosphomannomutase
MVRLAISGGDICQSWFLRSPARELPLDAGYGGEFTEKLQGEPREFLGHQVKEAVRTDGLKLILDDGSWVRYRLSGTEPVVRVYSEAGSETGLEKLSVAAKQWIFE